MEKKIVIVGAGVGGLATAARLAKRGFTVEVCERLPNCGGRNNIIEDKGFKFDTGPSFVMMPDLFEEVFSYCGERLEDYLDLKVLDVNYKIFYPDADSLTVYQDSRRTKEELERIETGASLGYERFLKAAGGIYNQVKPLLYTCLTGKSLYRARYWPLAFKLRPFESCWHFAGRFFKSEKLCSAFTFESMFIGVSPYEAPAFYSMITYSDHFEKIRHSMGGMYRIPLALEKLAQKKGAAFNYNSEIKRIHKDRVKFILETAERDIISDKVVINADYPYAQDELIGRRIPRYRYSCSTYLLYLGLKKKIEGLGHHNLFFASDLKNNLKEIFQDKVISDDPSFYVHVPTVTDASLAPAGKDILYILIPVPNLDNARDDINYKKDLLRKAVFQRLNKLLSVNLEDLIEVEHAFYPLDFIQSYNIKYGATFGLAHTLGQSAFFRPPNFDPKVKNLYYVGASTQPGGGLPVVIAGSRIVSDLIR